MHVRTLILATLAAATTAPAVAQTTSTPVTVVVSIPIPAGAPRGVIEAGIRKAVPDYRRVPGLLRKYFTIGEGEFGGVYLFASRAAAQAWFGDAWRARVAATYHAPATVTYYDVPVVLDNAPVPAVAQAQP
jgi:hypothetical protein